MIDLATIAQQVVAQMVGFEVYLGFSLVEVDPWPDNDVPQLFVVRLIVLWREWFPDFAADPLLGPQRDPAAREALVEALERTAAFLRSRRGGRLSLLSSPERLARLFESAAEEFRQSLLRLRGH